MTSRKLDSFQTPCPSCGRPVSASRTTCDHCGAALLQELPEPLVLPEPPKPYPIPLERPGCLTAYATLLALGGVSMILGAIDAWLHPLLYRYSDTIIDDLVLCGIPPVSAIINFLVAYGLWNTRNWGRILAIAYCSLGIVVTLVGWIIGIIRSGQWYGFGAGVVSTFIVAGLIINIAIVVWLIQNKQYFD